MATKYKDLQVYKHVSGIYKLIINNHCYIGSSNNLRNRLRCHIKALEANRHENQYIQRLYNKHGENNFHYQVIRTYDNITEKELLIKETEYINLFKADINFKKDPSTQRNCETTSRKIYQFSNKGELIKEWKSISEASRSLKVDSSCISVCINHPERIRRVRGFIWSDKKDSFNYKFIKAFDLNGNLVGKYFDTKDVWNSLFPQKRKKDVLTAISKQSKVNGRYNNYYFTLDNDYVPKISKTIYQFDKKGNFIAEYKEHELKNLYKINYVLRGTVKTYKGFYWSYDKDFEPSKLKLPRSYKIG